VDYLIYLNNPKKETLQDLRYVQLAKQINTEIDDKGKPFNIIRKYLAGIDVPYKDIKEELPYVTRNGDLISFEEFYEEITGEQF
tara:strand:+ start:1808 stop:2059 length:252 start_codon:yes stop_codon:yes gene_type:complete